ncbi:MAG: ATP-binding cassette domain-containing protein [Legionellales bacterium]|nr:ATP-binding cassette domain-containing protein [Legionellales bacterium]
MQFNTLIGDMGTFLSGGQKQHVLLARALYSNPLILFLDEATSHLDLENEAFINHSIRASGLTPILIAPRQETVEICDEIINQDNAEKNKNISITNIKALNNCFYCNTVSA